ncbi:MAG: PD40 domain-containing protein, partial [Deltaproteobacteria bacterium]|nr:PD40 domain-containing protein [Deltaproteobacteria bacterium]
IYRSTTSGFSVDESKLIATITDINTLTFDDNDNGKGLEKDKNYYYRIAICDQAGNTGPACTEEVGCYREIVFISNKDGDNEIYVANDDGTCVLQLTDNSANDFGPRWSPDGTQIVFASNRDGNWEIYKMDADGSNQINLTNNPANDGDWSDWSPSGDEIVFMTDRDGNYNIYKMNADGSNQVQLTNDPATDKDPQWAPGDKILFTSIRTGARRIFKMDPDGSNEQQVTGDDWCDYGTWNPDKQNILYFKTGSPGQGMYKINPDGTGNTLLYGEAGKGTLPHYSPDGTKIIMVHQIDSVDYDIYTINSDGSNPQLLVDDNKCAQFPDWR